MNAINWKNACVSDLRRLNIIKILLKNHVKLLTYLFDKRAPRLNASSEELKNNGFSQGEKVLIELALDIWSNEGGSKVMEITHGLDYQNFKRSLHVLTLLRSL